VIEAYLARTDINDSQRLQARNQLNTMRTKYTELTGQAPPASATGVGVPTPQRQAYTPVATPQSRQGSVGPSGIKQDSSDTSISGGTAARPSQHEERRGTVAKRKVREMLDKNEAEPEVEDVGGP
jgi:hypothetical protein